MIEIIMGVFFLIGVVGFICMALGQRENKIANLEAQLKLTNDFVKEKVYQIEQQEERYNKLLSQKKSSEVKVGQTVEQLVGFLDSFPYPNEEIKALYQPVDLIVFKEDEIVFIEVKSGDSQLSPKQRKIKELVQSGKVRFEVHRINGKGYEIK
jgi:predicted Holliday junction resolvase-like endonuclease